MALIKNIEIESDSKSRELNWRSQNRLLRSGYSMRADSRERRRNNMGFGSFTKAKQEIAVESPSALQLMCKKNSKKEKRAKRHGPKSSKQK